MTVEELDTRIRLARQAKAALIAAMPPRRDMNAMERYVLSRSDFDRLYGDNTRPVQSRASTRHVGAERRALLLDARRRLLAAGEPITEVELSEATGLSRQAVVDTRWALIQSGEWNPQARYLEGDEARKEIHRRLDAAIRKAGSMAALAREMGVSPSYILEVKCNRSRRNGRISGGNSLLPHLGLMKVRQSPFTVEVMR